MNTVLSDPPSDFLLDWAEAVRVIEHWAEPPYWAEPPLALPRGTIAAGDAPEEMRRDQTTPSHWPSQVASSWVAASARWRQACQYGWDVTRQEVAHYAPPVAALSLVSFAGGYWPQEPLAAAFDLRAPDFVAIEASTFNPRFTIPSPPIAAIAAIAHPERI